MKKQNRMYEHLREHFGSDLLKKTPALGIEVECERGTHIKVKGWEVKGDGSLRDNGCEFVSDGPVAFGDVEEHLRTLCSSVAEHPDNFVHNYRTSVHVHLNIAPLSPQQFGVLILEYLLLERWFYDKCDDERRTGPYAIPLSDASNALRCIAQDLKRGTHDCMVHLLQIEPKYCGLSFYRLRDLGTVEFRMLHGTSEFDELRQWCSAIMRLYNHASEYDGEYSFKNMKEFAIQQAEIFTDGNIPFYGIDVINQLEETYKHLDDRRARADGVPKTQRIKNRARKYPKHQDDVQVAPNIDEMVVPQMVGGRNFEVQGRNDRAQEERALYRTLYHDPNVRRDYVDNRVNMPFALYVQDLARQELARRDVRRAAPAAPRPLWVEDNHEEEPF